MQDVCEAITVREDMLNAIKNVKTDANANLQLGDGLHAEPHF